MAAVEGDTGVLDEQAFRHFKPLLAACQGLAALSGCRFRNDYLNGISMDHTKGQLDTLALPTVNTTKAKDSGCWFTTILQSRSVVKEFIEKLHMKEPGLLEDIDRALRIVMAEGIRNAMRGMLQALGMFPPSPPPHGIEDDDCSYEDTEASLPVIAQRLYNDQVRRIKTLLGGSAYYTDKR